MTPVSSSPRRPVLLLALALVILLSGREVGRAASSLAFPSARPASPVVPSTPDENRARGLNFDGLRPGDGKAPCGHKFELVLSGGEVVCTHGPDAAPPGVDVTEPAPVPMVSEEAATALATAVSC